jgi:hypothetical protein
VRLIIHGGSVIILQNYKTNGSENLKQFDRIAEQFRRDFSEPQYLEGAFFVPFQFIQFIDGEILTSVAPGLENFTAAFMKNFSNRVFSAEALACLEAELPEELFALGFESLMTSGKYNPYTFMYGCADKTALHPEKIQATTVQFDSKTEFVNTTESYNPFFDLTNPRIYFGTVLDEKNIVSIVGHAMELGLLPELDAVSVGVETNADYRRRGYAVSNVTAMTQYLLELGHIVTYSCHSKNENSQKTALSAGFIKIAEQYGYFAKSS